MIFDQEYIDHLLFELSSSVSDIDRVIQEIGADSIPSKDIDEAIAKLSAIRRVM